MITLILIGFIASMALLAGSQLVICALADRFAPQTVFAAMFSCVSGALIFGMAASVA